jgi:hypothetical protein
MYPAFIYYLTWSLEWPLYFFALAFLFSQLIRHFPRSFTFAESFTASWLITTYCHYALHSLTRQAPSAGVSGFNAIVFIPWVMLVGVALLTAMQARVMEVSITTVGCDFALVITLIASLNLPWITFLRSVIFSEASLLAIVYMTVILAMSLPALYWINQKKTLEQMTVRKLYHLLAFLLFAPSLFHFDQDRNLARMMVFAFNCVTVLLILIEWFRCKFPRHGLAKMIGGYFQSFCDGREGGEQLIVTHI